MKKNHQSSILNPQSLRGFTLIELLIVIAIIGVLSTLLMANFIGVRQRARDAQRKSDIRQIQSALEIYRSDVGSYPSVGIAPGFFPQTTCGTGVKLTNVGATATYMGTIPCDPNGSAIGFNSGRYYYVSTDGVTYTLASCIENTSDTSQGVVPNSPAPVGNGSCSSVRYFVVNNP
jgi:general secretion pathway protein G